MNFKKITTMGLLILTLLSLSIAPVSAAKKGTVSGYIWDQSTGQVTAYDPSHFKTEVTIPVDPEPIQGEIQDPGSITPMLLYMYTLDHYSESSQTLNWQQKYVGVTRIDNSGSVSPTTIIFTATSTDTWSMSGTTGLETSAEKDLILAKVKVTASVSGTSSRSWQSQQTYGTSSTVPAHTIGKITAYIPGTSSNGYAVYKVTNTSNDDWWWQDRARGAIVPAQNAWNFVVTIPCS